MKILVYTTNLNDYDNLHEAPGDGLTYLYYTDGEAPEGWKKKEMQGDSRKESRYYKINSHKLPPHDISIYIDACYAFHKPISDWIDILGDSEVMIARHGKDSTVYEHVGTCISTGKDDPKKMIKQVARYDIPDNQIFTENSIIIRRNTDKVKKMNEIWWQEYLVGSERDQLSLPEAILKSGVEFKELPFSARENEYVSGWARHKTKFDQAKPQDSHLWGVIKSDIINEWNSSENKEHPNTQDLSS